MPRHPAKPTRQQFGSIRSLPSGRFQATYRRDGRELKAPSTFATRAQAQDWLLGEHVDRRRSAWLDPDVGVQTLADYTVHWMAARPDLAARTRDLYERVLNRWILPPVPGSADAGLGEYALHSITPTIVRTWHGYVLAAGRKGALRRIQAGQSPKRAVHPARAWARATEWAASTGRRLGDSGRMPPELLTAWEAAGAPLPADTMPPTLASAHPDAGKTTAAQAYRVLRAILTTAHTDGLIPANPCRVKGAGTVHHPERSVLAPAEVDQLAEHFPERLRAAVVLAAWSSLRSGEQFALARRHVDLKAGTIRVERALVRVSGQPTALGNTKTLASSRTINLPGFVVEQLRAHMAKYTALGPDALIFTLSDDGGPVHPVLSSNLSWYVRRARAAIGRPEITWHDLRHTGATLSYVAGASTREVMNRLGHTTARAAQIYAHAADDSDRLLADRLDRLHSPAPVTSINEQTAQLQRK